MNDEQPLPPQHYEPYHSPVPPQRFIPNIGHAALFFALTVPALFGGEIGSALALKSFHHFRHRSLHWLFNLMATDTRFSIPAQAVIYAVLVGLAVPIFTVLWQERFADGVHWNAAAAARRFFVLLALGLAVGFGITLVGNYLPMPKDPPILRDMMKSASGAWAMLVFGVTVAPMVEELAFRGFLLPGFLNIFRRFAQRGRISEAAARWVGVPVSIVLTTIPFALLHATQVSNAWGPLLLIGTVSVVLCIVRLTMDSVAAGAVVHAAYNFTLFAGVLVQTGGFRHLDKLTG